MKQLSILFFIIVCFTATAQDNSPYKINWKLDAPLLIGGTGLLAGNALWSRNITPLNPEEINALDANNIWKFDRSATHHYSHNADIASDVFFFGTMALPASLLVMKGVREDFLTLVVMGSEVYLWNSNLVIFTKNAVKRSRPYTYNPAVPLEVKMNRGARFSFFSGHTSTVSSLSFFMATVIHDYSDNRTLRIVSWTTAATLPAVTGYLRYRAGKHFPTDLITGYIVGGAVGTLIPYLHRNRGEKTYSLVPTISSEQVGLYFQWKM